MRYVLQMFFFVYSILPLSAQSNFCTDCDKDGLIDSLEQILAEKFAPIIVHDTNEPNFPTDVDVYLQHTALFIFDDECDFPRRDIHRLIKDKPIQQDLINRQFDDNFCGSTGLVKSNCTRSVKKQRTYYLRDVEADFKKGSTNTKEWTTYFHAYKNTRLGVTIQYWRFYSFNTGLRVSAFDFSHGGDWECVQVVLNDSLMPLFVDFLGHTSIDRQTWESLEIQFNHPIVYSQMGSHSSLAHSNQSGIRQETWSGGKVNHTNGSVSDSGILLNVGEKLVPLNNQVFIQYSGIWGSPGSLFFTSGYWSPTYNETEMDSNTQFIKAWCNEMADSSNIEANGVKECFPCGTSR